ncbi:phosphotriesterase family protein [Candidatus Poriferisodalis sp.]|uniref:phosphotriesterase family protein n=1 Tax=Candidatus Poriferisodalis sp. TaxID=3101277 RepID=UPI003B5C8D1D
MNHSEGRIIRTVTGDIAPRDLGRTSAHEHILCDMSWGFAGKTRASDHRDVLVTSVAQSELWWLREHHIDVLDNCVLDDIDLAIREVGRFKQPGGVSIVDVTCDGLGPRPDDIRRISVESGVQIVLGCGHYVEDSHPAGLDDEPVESIAARFVDDIETGIAGSSVRAGVIGELGCSWPVRPNERKVLAAAAIAHGHTGVAISVHTGRNRQAARDHVDELGKQGVAPSSVVICHVDRRIDDDAGLHQLAATGCFLAFDCFGLEPWIAPEARGMPMPGDVERAKMIAALIDGGYGENILVGQDIAMKHRLAEYGGHGYGYILRMVPTILEYVGLSQREIDTLLIDNPARAFSFARPSRKERPS